MEVAKKHASVCESIAHGSFHMLKKLLASQNYKIIPISCTDDMIKSILVKIIFQCVNSHTQNINLPSPHHHITTSPHHHSAQCTDN